ncbi:LPXTG-motif cell wall anchor domain-containing protein/fimbrial isopeptide formation D2 domain-containing protein [Butyrivibrio sp. INlla18]|uniref:SpaA isopeptide-forming pilin-related protein n=1 Tax=Butyrivibrio sp. INlla18 TaxID=1520806 RepID=UPI0008812305|nr:SpaA isopeptide-forming pilin-related protein [Butyrivibrio sp. INlla18]SDA79959.1 LPXTG-motif cell wall anchor domain-containing protein/fimbrial isopeptide formation D2 domain-containing protein [Butyrivibrio sp. INlla18]
MKGIKKILTGIIAGAMALSMVFSAGNALDVKAAGNGSITVSNTTQGESYALYKVFDATYEGDKVAYTYDGSNNAFLAALQASTSPFTVSEYNGVYSVVRKENTADDAVINFVKDNAANFGTAIDTLPGNGGEITFSGLDYGYYYITSTLGVAVTIDSATPNATVIDKNQETTVDKQESVDEVNWLYVGMGETETPVPTQMVGMKVNYKVTGTVTQYIGKDQVTFLLFTDTLSEGLTADKNVEVKVDGTVVNAEVNYDGQTTTIKLVTADANLKPIYPSNAQYEITYSATVNEKAVDMVQNNEVKLTDNNENTIGTDRTEVVNYNIFLIKKDAKTGDVLADAEFKLFTTETGDVEIPVVLVSGTGDATSTENIYRVATAQEIAGGEAVDTMVTGKTGVIEVKGFANGTYYFEETKAPAGYNRLETRTPATVNGANTAEIPVLNNSGSLLPSTGGIGTTIFYILGGILIVAGIAYFIVRRKADAE